MSFGRINFDLTCPHCGKTLTGTPIVDVGGINDRAFFYTDDGHQLAYTGPHLDGVSCLAVQEADDGYYEQDEAAWQEEHERIAWEEENEGMYWREQMGWL